MKFDAQYEETDIATNFDVATLRIYNENYIGRMRDWSILNTCWPKNRVDRLVYKVLANIVNMLFHPICAKDGRKSKSRKCLMMQRCHFHFSYRSIRQISLAVNIHKLVTTCPASYLL